MQNKTLLFLIISLASLTLLSGCQWEQNKPEAQNQPSFLKKYKNIIFDLGGVLHSEPYSKAQTMTLLGKLWSNMFNPKMFSILWNMRQEINALFASDMDPIWIDLWKGAISEKEAATQLIEKTKEFLGKKELDSINKEDILTWFDNVRYYTKPLPQGMKLLKQAKDSGHKIFILSNISKEDYEYILQHPDLKEAIDLADGQILSYQVGTLKPESKIYKKLLETYNLKPKECIFIDNKQAMIDGAKSVGIEGIVFDN